MRFDIIYSVDETIKVIEPSVKIERLQREVIAELSVLLPDSILELIGSMAVPIAGRSEIDVMVISDNPDFNSKLLSEKGYKQGSVVNQISYLSMKRNGIRVDLQIIPANHEQIESHRRILKKLRDNSGLRKKYQEFKKTLDGLSPEEYKKRKSEWIQFNLLDKNNFK